MSDYLVNAFAAMFRRLGRRIRLACADSGSDAARGDSDLPGEATDLELIWSEEFDGDLSRWNQNDHEVDPLHRTGYKHLELDGSVNPGLDHIKVAGRWGALMDKHREKVQFISDGYLVLKGYAEKGPNPYRKNFTTEIEHDDGTVETVPQPYGDWMVWAAWLSSWGRKWSEELQRHVTDWDRTQMPLLGPGHVLKVRANVENLIMAGGRFSIWGMPATEEQDTPEREVPARVVASDSYDDDASEMEVDVLETENPQGYDSEFGQTVFMKCVGGDAGDTPNGQVNVLKKHGIDVRKGFHVYELKHNHDGTIDFKIDDVLVNHESRAVTMWWYVVLSNEFCSGCKDPILEPNIAAHENHADGPHQPPDAGLSGRSFIQDIDLIDQHEVLVDWVRAYKLKKTG